MKLTNTPWGKPDQQKQIAEGIVKVCTPSHGGIWLSPQRRADMPKQYRDIPTFAGANWYEEDCDWALVALSFPQYFDQNAVTAATETLTWLKANSDRFAA